jgi:hypothetical protein
MTLRARFAICALLAASAGRAAAGCHDSAIHGWLDFWLGDWIVCEGRERAGTDRVTKVLDGCAVAEDWTGVDGSHGLSLFYVVLPDRTWRQVWVTDAARRAGGWKEKRLVAHPAEGSVRFQGEIAPEDGRRMLDRTTPRPPVGRRRMPLNRRARRARIGRRIVLATLVSMLVQSPADAQPAPTCDAAEHRAFDFWLGSWDVSLPDGRAAGTNRIERTAGGCALIEHWQGTGGFVGTSLNWYDRDDARWHQVWVDGTGGTLVLAGARDGERMVLTSLPAAGERTRQRIAWSPQADGSVRQHWETSDDAGATWRTVFDGRYVRRP